MTGADRHSPQSAPPPDRRPAARSRLRGTLLRTAWIANTLCTAAYLAWLACGGRESLFYDRDGVLLLLPVIPIVAVFLVLCRESLPKRSATRAENLRSDLGAWLRRPPRKR